jgi:hypothetical protein
MSCNTLCPCISSVGEQYSRILHNMHFDHVIWHHNAFCNIFVWKMSLWIFFKLSIWISCFRVLFGCKNTFAHLAYINREKNYVDIYIYWVLGEITVMYHKKFQDLNINKSYFCNSDANRRNFNWICCDIIRPI